LQFHTQVFSPSASKKEGFCSRGETRAAVVARAHAGHLQAVRSDVYVVEESEREGDALHKATAFKQNQRMKSIHKL
jgi:hypothetical protein